MSLAEAPKEIDGHGLLRGKVVLVTAAAGTGIGSATARRALAEGADVVVSDYHERRLGQTRDELAALGLGKVDAVVCDVTSTAAVDALITETVATAGRLDVLVNNAGLGGQTPVVDMTDDEWDRVLDVTLTSVMRATRAALRYFRGADHGGVIVNNASVLGWRAQHSQAHYAAAKAGVMALTRCSAIEAVEFGCASMPSRRASPGTSSWRRPAQLICWTGCRPTRRSVGPPSHGRSPPPSPSWPATTPVISPGSDLRVESARLTVRQASAWLVL